MWVILVMRQVDYILVHHLTENHPPSVQIIVASNQDKFPVNVEDFNAQLLKEITTPLSVVVLYII